MQQQASKSAHLFKRYGEKKMKSVKPLKMNKIFVDLCELYLSNHRLSRAHSFENIGRWFSCYFSQNDWPSLEKSFCSCGQQFSDFLLMALRRLGVVTAVSNKNGVQDSLQLSEHKSSPYGCAGFFARFCAEFSELRWRSLLGQTFVLVDRKVSIEYIIVCWIV